MAKHESNEGTHGCNADLPVDGCVGGGVFGRVELVAVVVGPRADGRPAQDTGNPNPETSTSQLSGPLLRSRTHQPRRQTMSKPQKYQSKTKM